MNPLIQLKKATPLFLVGLVLVCFGLVQNTGAIIPAPDGCYPAFTTAEGCNALDLLTTGVGNTGVGWRSLFSNTTGSFNTGVGNGNWPLNNGDSNTAVGAAALLLNTTGTENSAIGTAVLVHNSTGGQNTATGAFALFVDTGHVFHLSSDPELVSMKCRLFGSHGRGNGAPAIVRETAACAK